MNPKSRSNSYEFKSTVWRYGQSGWHFVTLPKQLAQRIRKVHGVAEEGWGRLKATAQIGKSEWKTAIWYDTKAGSYILPLKAKIRDAEGVGLGSRLSVGLRLTPVDPILRRFKKTVL